MADTIIVPDSNPEPAAVVAPVSAPISPPAETNVTAVPQPISTPHDDIMDQAVKDTIAMPLPQPTMQASIANSISTNPDMEAEARKVAMRTGVPVQTVFAQPEVMKQKAAMADIDFDNFQKLYPGTATALSNEELAKVAHDDTNNMGLIETSLKKITNVGKSLYMGAGPMFAEGFYGTLETGAALVGADKGVTNARGFFHYLREGAKAESARITESMGPMGYTETGIMSGFQSLGQTLPGALLAVSTGNATPLLAVAGIGQGGQSAGNALDAGRSPLMAATYGTSDAAIEIGTEMIPIAKLIGDTKAGSTLIKTLAHQVMTEVPGELIATTFQNLNEWAVIHPDQPFSSYLKQLPADLGQTVIATMTAIGAQTGVVHAANRHAMKDRQAAVAETDAANFEQLNALASDSKLRPRDPLAFQNFVEDVAQSQGAIQDVYVNPRDLAQAGLPLEQLAEASPVIAEQYRQALEIGSDMKIPISEYTTHLAGTELGQSMVDFLKTNPLGMSAFEAREFRTSQENGQLQNDAETELLKEEPDKAFNDSAAKVKQSVLEKLTTANRFTKDVNEQYATLHSNFYKAQASRLGVTPEELYTQHPADIQSIMDKGDTLNQDSAHPTADILSKYSDAESFADDALKGKNDFFNITTPEKQAEFAEQAELEKRQEELRNEAQNVSPRSKKGKTLGAEFAEVTGRLREIQGNPAPSGYVDVGSPSSTRQKLIDFYNNQKSLNQDYEVSRRGSFNPESSTITLLKNADLSTFLHETGHFFLETMNKLASDQNAPEAIKKDMQAVFDWLGVKDIAEWNSHDLEWQRDKHEQFARGFEAYLFEGKSPSIEMRAVFQRFRAWLVNVYHDLSELNVELNDEVRSVFSRMLATQEQVSEAELARGYEPMFKDAQTAGMNESEWKAYQELSLDATQNSIDELETRSLRDMKYLSNAHSRALKDLQRQAAGRRREIRDEVTKEVMAEPVNQAREFLTKGKFDIPADAPKSLRRAVLEKSLGSTKLSLPALKEMYGEKENAVWRHFSTGKSGEVGTEGIHPDIAAEMFGFSSGDELVRALLSEDKPKVKIAAVTDQKMLERYGDLTNPDNLARAADEAIHNDVRARFVATELNALQKATGGRKILAAAAKEFASNMVNRLKIRDISPAKYSAAEGRAARNAEKALMKGDLPAAAVEKRNQLIQNYAAKAAFDAQREVEKAVQYFKGFDREGTRKNIDSDYLDQIDSLLDRFDLRKSTTLKTIDKRKSLLEWKTAQEEIGLEPEIPPELLDAAERKHYKDMTVEEIRGLRDTIKQIDHLGKLKNRLLTAKDNRDFKTTVQGLVKSILENSNGKVVDNRTRANTAYRIGELFKGFVASHRKVASLVRELDGVKDGGAMWETFVRTMNEAGNKEAMMRAAATKDLSKLIKPLLAEGKMGGKGDFFPSIGKSLNREERIGIALNVGNKGNLQRLLDGEGWSIEQLRPVLDSLNKNEWDSVQNIWGFIESFRPEIGAKEKRVYGKEPDWVEPNPVQTKFGEYKGGYYPIKYDNRRSIAAEQYSDAESAKQQMKGAFTSATTRRSFTKTRADEVKGRPLLYSMNGLYNGVNEIIHDLSWHEWLIDANRLLRNKTLDSTIRNSYGAEVTKQFKTSVQDIAGGEMPTGTSFEKALADLRGGAVVAGLGFNIVNSFINLTGITNSVVRVGPKWVAIGVGKFAANPKALVKEVNEKSDFMRLRAQTMMRELNEIQSQVRGKTKAREVMDKVMFAPMTITQIAVDTPTWYGAYQKALTAGESEDRSVALADQAVLDSQSGGQVKDMAAIQRGGPLQKLFTTFYGYFNAAYNIGVEQTKKTNFKDPVSVMKLGGDYLMLYSVPAVLGRIIQTALTGGDDDWDPEVLAKNLANDQISYLMGLMVGSREITGAIQTVAGVNPYTSSYGGPAGLRFFQEFFNLATQIHQGEADAALLKSVSNIAGILLHLPSSQINRTVGGIDALIEGETENPAAVFAGPPKKK